MCGTWLIKDAMNGANEVDWCCLIETGWLSDMKTELKQRVAAYVRDGSDVKSFYVGITSGNSVELALRRRYDTYKRDNGFNVMVCVYQSSSQNLVRDAEAILVEHFKGNPKNANLTGGGGGNISNGPNHYLYLALRYWPKNFTCRNR